MMLLYLLLRLQQFLPLNPAGQTAVAPDLALNTTISFATSTSWESYGGETTLSHFSQMAGIAVQSFLSAAAGIAAALALTRGFARRGSDQRSAQFLGRYHARHTLYPGADLRAGRADHGLAGRAADPLRRRV